MNHPIVAILNELRETQFRPRELMLEYQRRLLEPLLRHAREHVPFYRDTGRLGPVFRRDDSIDWERWGEIPYLTRKEVQQNFELLKAEVLPAGHEPTWVLSTSGSTAEPVRVVHTKFAGRYVWAAQILRDLERHRIDPTRRLVLLNPPREVKASTSPPICRNFWFPGLDEIGLFGERYYLADTRPVTELIDEVVALRPDYVCVQPIALQLMCAHDHGGRLANLDIDALMTVGDQFDPEAKRDVALHLGCRILDTYASEECGRIASNCPGCGRYHLDSEANFAEIVDEDGAAAKPGDVGWVLITPLHNYAMPLIRYDHVDQARVGEPDQCRITLPALDEIIGKERARFVFNGVAMRPTLSSKVVIALLGAQSYQVAQVAPDRCEVRIVPGDRSPSEMQFDELTQLLRAIWWDRLNVDYRIVDAIPRRSPRGKAPLTVYEVPQGGTVG